MLLHALVPWLRAFKHHHFVPVGRSEKLLELFAVALKARLQLQDQYRKGRSYNPESLIPSSNPLK